MKKLITTFILFIITNFLSAHEFWLQPDKFIYEPGDPINIRFQVGENFEGENWSGDTAKIKSLYFYYADVQDDLKPAMGTGQGDSIQLSVMDEGTAMITFNSKNSFIELDAAKFNAYLHEDGLEEIIDYRKQLDETDSSGREVYQRSTKTIFQVGKELTNTFSQQTSLPLDIILQQNPFLLDDPETITAKIFFLHEPLKNSLVKIWHREKGATIKVEMTTDENGEISFEIAPTGEWMVSCVKMIRFGGDSRCYSTVANWQSYWGSCTWGYE